MLRLENIYKRYTTGDFTQVALNGVSLTLRDNEFVAILGPSGSGKTTMLNIIGGLDRYDEGDLVINGVSTKKYNDRDWDSYRNHTVGFVFQSYNLIGHQSVLANVELALTISGVSKSERTQRAREALEKVGLGDHVDKKPNQLSGGQMQRVAIARALVNNPDIVLADEPTGALDSDTSVQIMELLKEVAKDRLVVMVTHNPELAEDYATRIVRVRDGVIKDDSNPVTAEEAGGSTEAKHETFGKASMNFATAMSLSFKNLWTKKARTLLTAFAGSIGIIGIALILSLSTGVNDYIAGIQEEAMNAYPISISAETVDMTSLMSSAGMMAGDAAEVDKDRSEVYANNAWLEMDQTMNASITENNLTDFKRYLDDPDSDIQDYLGENGVVYTYDMSFDVYAKDENGDYVDTDRDAKTSRDEQREATKDNKQAELSMNMNPMTTGAQNGAQNFEQLLPGTDGALVSKVITDSYDMVYGEWPQKDTDVVLALDDKNSIPSNILYQLGLLSEDDYEAIRDDIENEKTPEDVTFNYKDLCGTTFSLVPACDYYQKQEDGTFKNVKDDAQKLEKIVDKGVELKVVGIIRPKDGSENKAITANVGYTSALTERLASYSDDSAVVKAQEATPDTNVLNGVAFKASSDAEKAADAKKYMKSLGVSEKAQLLSVMMMSSSSSADTTTTAAMSQMGTDEASLAQALDSWLDNDPDQEALVSFYDQAMGDTTLEDNLEDFGKVSLDAPYSINIYTDTFEDKEAVNACIAKYNEGVSEDDKITYTDFVALLTSSLTSMVNVVTYVLVAFVAVSLVVSCIMIGIITHISVMERTKEIGILRAMGASKRNISQVFNAETLIIGLCSGAIGVGASVLAAFPINAILQNLLENVNVHVALPWQAAIILVVLSILVTILGGIIPARKASHKDPVEALRTE